MTDLIFALLSGVGGVVMMGGIMVVFLAIINWLGDV